MYYDLQRAMPAMNSFCSQQEMSQKSEHQHVWVNNKVKYTIAYREMC